jgi:hypothetical protein
MGEARRRIGRSPEGDLKGPPADTLRSGVLLPDGRVVQPFMQTFPDEDAWRGEMDRQVKAQRDTAAAA